MRDRPGVPPWWTAADQAELGVLLWELVKAHAAHKERCLGCVGNDWCRTLTDGLELVLEWREGRALRSEALWLRRMHDLERDVHSIFEERFP